MLSTSHHSVLWQPALVSHTREHCGHSLQIDTVIRRPPPQPSCMPLKMSQGTPLFRICIRVQPFTQNDVEPEAITASQALHILAEFGKESGCRGRLATANLILLALTGLRSLSLFRQLLLQSPYIALRH